MNAIKQKNEYYQRRTELNCRPPGYESGAQVKSPKHLSVTNLSNQIYLKNPITLRIRIPYNIYLNKFI